MTCYNIVNQSKISAKIRDHLNRNPIFAVDFFSIKNIDKDENRRKQIY